MVTLWLLTGQCLVSVLLLRYEENAEMFALSGTG